MTMAAPMRWRHPIRAGLVRVPMELQGSVVDGMVSRQGQL